MSAGRSTTPRGTSREGQLRIEQRVGESADIFALRAFMKAVPYMTQNECLAASNWLARKGIDYHTLGQCRPETWREQTERAVREFQRRKASGK